MMHKGNWGSSTKLSIRVRDDGMGESVRTWTWRVDQDGEEH